ncbi:hypothetical protein D3C71_1143740 [compost metagenome]
MRMPVRVTAASCCPWPAPMACAANTDDAMATAIAGNSTYDITWLAGPHAAVAAEPCALTRPSRPRSASEPVMKNRPVGTPSRTRVRSKAASSRRCAASARVGASTCARRRRCQAV